MRSQLYPEDKLRRIEAPAPKATRREWIGLAVIALPCLLYSMDLTVLGLAVPALSAALAPTSTQLLWIMDIYGFLVAGFLIPMGTLGDRIGRRKLLMWGAAAFGLASVLAAFSTSARMLIVTRAILGVAGATVAPSTLSLIRNMFHDEKERTTAISIWVMSYSVGFAIGPLVGGVLLEHFWWGSVFLIAAPPMVLLMILAPMLLPEFRDPRAGRIDFASALLSLAAVLSVIYGLKQMAQYGFTWPRLMSIAAGAVIGIVFVRRQRTLADPFLDLDLFRARTFRAAIATYMLAVFIASGLFFFIAQYLQLVLGLSPLMAGVWTLPGSVGFTAGSLLSPALVARFQPGTVMAGCLTLAATGFAIVSQVEHLPTLAVITVGCLFYTLGLSPVVTVATDLIMRSAPPERAGAAAAISETGAEFGGALGIAIIGSFGTAIYRRLLDDSFPDVARDTLGGAVNYARELPAREGAALLATARDAFTSALEATAWTSAIGAMLLAVVAAMAFKRN